MDFIWFCPYKLTVQFVMFGLIPHLLIMTSFVYSPLPCGSEDQQMQMKINGKLNSILRHFPLETTIAYWRCQFLTCYLACLQSMGCAISHVSLYLERRLGPCNSTVFTVIHVNYDLSAFKWPRIGERWSLAGFCWRVLQQPLARHYFRINYTSSKFCVVRRNSIDKKIDR